MPGLSPVVKVAAVQAAPRFLDTAATIHKLRQLVSEASANGAQIVAFGESFLSGFPIWNGVLPPIYQHDFHVRLVESAIEVPGNETTELGKIARSSGVMLSVGVNEKNPNSVGQVWNTNLIFSPDGEILNHRRKLVGTWYERLTWSHGDAHDLTPVNLNNWGVGALICGENTNPLARYALLAQGERIHIAPYPPAWPFDERESIDDYDLQAAIQIRTAGHSFDGKVHSIAVATVMDDTALDEVAGKNGTIREQLIRTAPLSVIVGPRGSVIAGPLPNKEGTLYATLDLREQVALKQAHDVVGTYQRNDLFSLTIDMSRPRSLVKRQTTLGQQVAKSKEGPVSGFSSQDAAAQAIQ